MFPVRGMLHLPRAPRAPPFLAVTTLHNCLVASGLATLVACSGSMSDGGNLVGAVGDVSNAPAAKGSPTDELDAACGDGSMLTDGLLIKRRPYLQQVSSTSAAVGWVTTGQKREHVHLSLPDGTSVMDAGGEVDEKAERVGDQRQMWAHATGLQANTIYCYAISGDSPMTARDGFRTAPAADSTAPVKFLAFGDSGGGGDIQYALTEQMTSYPFDLMVHTGDIAYDNGTLGEFEANVFGVYAGLFRSIPFYPSAGNHEYNNSATAAPFRSVFAFPGTTGESWYSYDWGPIHFAVLDTEADYDTQMAWLDDDLKSSDRPWKIVYLHRPPYSTGEHGSDTGLRTKLAPVVEGNRVQLVLAGHDHDYERMIPQNGVAYVVTGGGGKGTRPVGKSAFTAHSTDAIHFVYGEVGRDTMTLHAIDATGAEFDTMIIQR
jgi:acid phosphatase type 7